MSEKILIFGIVVLCILLFPVLIVAASFFPEWQKAKNGGF